ncbi:MULTISPECIES: hypothetical protein [unclassified Pseudonocardia]|jgi:hypothetical protein|uniref:hypothetical protein n=1 Tax=unclassified Pseudonocardia TaxID=2619320 RepID=UPI001AD5A463|nr:MULTISPECIES: hypothetical protein [unclassified Pseudonocardia]MBN9101974.1 hypothetical protein [Pseudonocardia sp.]
MTITGKDGVATVCVAAAVALYGFWSNGMPLFGLTGPRAVAVAVLVLGVAACTSARSHLATVYGAGDEPRPPLPYVVLVSVTGLATLVAGAIALIGGNVVALAVLAGGIVVLWVLATVRHLMSGDAPRPSVGSGRPHPGRS